MAKTLEISTLDELNYYLNDLQAGASYSLDSIIKGQLEVIRSIESPTLVNTALDSLLLYLKRSLESSTSPQERDTIRDQFSLMIQNYAFFFYARLQFEIHSNREETTALYTKAGEMLSNSVMEIGQMAAIPGGMVSKTSSVIVKNFFAPVENGAPTFLSRLITLWGSKKNIAKKKEELYKMLETMFSKLDRHSNLIGSSLVISEMIHNYAPELTDHHFKKEEASIEESISEREVDLEKVGTGKSVTLGIIFIVGVFTIIIRWIWRLLGSAASGVASLFSDEKTVEIPDEWFLNHLLWVIGITIVIGAISYLINLSDKKEGERLLAEEKKKKDALLLRKEEHLKDFKNIALKFEP